MCTGEGIVGGALDTEAGIYFIFIPLALLGVRSIDHEMLFASQSFGDANLNNASRSR